MYCKIHKIHYRFFCPRCRRTRTRDRIARGVPRLPYGTW